MTQRVQIILDAFDQKVKGMTEGKGLTLGEQMDLALDKAVAAYHRNRKNWTLSGKSA